MEGFVLLVIGIPPWVDPVVGAPTLLELFLTQGCVPHVLVQVVSVTITVQPQRSLTVPYLRVRGKVLLYCLLDVRLPHIFVPPSESIEQEVTSLTITVLGPIVQQFNVPSLTCQPVLLDGESERLELIPHVFLYEERPTLLLRVLPLRLKVSIVVSLNNIIIIMFISYMSSSNADGYEPYRTMECTA